HVVATLEMLFREVGSDEARAPGYEYSHCLFLPFLGLSRGLAGGAAGRFGRRPVTLAALGELHLPAHLPMVDEGAGQCRTVPVRVRCVLVVFQLLERELRTFRR